MTHISADITSGDSINVSAVGDSMSAAIFAGDNISCSISIYEFETVQTSTPWTPAELANLSLWMDASDTDSITLDGSYVTQWSDISGNNKHATQDNESYRPTYDSTDQSINFNGDYLDLSSASTRAGIAVVRNANGCTSTTTVCFILSNGDYNNGPFLRTGSADYTLSLDGTYVITGDISINGETLQPGDGSGENISSSDANYIGFPTQNEADSVYWQWTDDNYTIDYIASMGYETSNYAANIDIHEILLFSSVPSVSDRQKAEGYLAHKWNFSSKLPAGHPYKNSTPTL